MKLSEAWLNQDFSAEFWLLMRLDEKIDLSRQETSEDKSEQDDDKKEEMLPSSCRIFRG